MQSQLQQLERDGYTIFPDFLDLQTTARVRALMDSLLPGVAPHEEVETKRVRTLRHPIPGALMAELLNRPRLLTLAQKLIEAEEMRLLEQVLIRTDPQDTSTPGASVHHPRHWHIDMAFLPEHYNARPRRTYFQMVHALSTVEPGGGGTMIIPGSHHKTYAVAERLGSVEALTPLKADPVGVADLDLNEAIELHPREGDLLVFNPMCLHSASTNVSAKPRYVYFTSFMDVSADYLRTKLDPLTFPDSLRENLPAELQPLLVDR